ncbi:MAG: hypothetical protein ACREP6_05840 [Candidatus Binataceae bacterium]
MGARKAVLSRSALKRVLPVVVVLGLLALLTSKRADAESLLDKVISGGSASASTQQNSATPLPPPGPATSQISGQPSSSLISSSRPIKSGAGMTARTESAVANSPITTPAAPEEASLSSVNQSAVGWSASAARSESLEDMNAALRKLSPHNSARNRRIERGAVVFPSFCQDWEEKLLARQTNNLKQIAWRPQNGDEAGTYTGYGPIKSCTTKLSTHGILIGELTYQEFTYALSGKTIDQAEHANPKPVAITNTLEIFRWDRTKWLY